MFNKRKSAGKQPILKRQKVESTPATVVIIGMGPGGLVAAIEAAKKDYLVVIIEKRDYYLREQPTILRPHNAQYLGFNDRKITFNKIQKKLEQQLLSYSNVQIKKGSQYEISNIDISNNRILLKNENKLESIEFNYLVAADGAKHYVADLFSEAARLKDETKHLAITYFPTSVQPRVAPHFAVTLQLNCDIINVNAIESDNYGLYSEKAYQKFKSFGWDNPMPPIARAYFVSTNDFFYVGGEISTQIINEGDDEKRKNLVVSWGKQIVKFTSGIKKKHLEVALQKNSCIKNDSKNDLNVNAFHVNLQHANTVALRLPSGGFFILVGDAAMNSYFIAAHGANNAIEDGIMFGKCLEKNDFKITSFIQYHKNKIVESNNKISDTISMINSDYFDYYFLNHCSEIIEYTKILISNALAYLDDIKLQAAKKTCEKACFILSNISASTIHHGDIFSTIKDLHECLEEKEEETPPLPNVFLCYNWAYGRENQNLSTTLPPLSTQETPTLSISNATGP